MLHIIIFKQIIWGHFWVDVLKLPVWIWNSFYYFISRWLNSAKYSLSFQQGAFFFAFLCPSLSPGRLTSLDGSFRLPYPLASIWIHQLRGTIRILEIERRVSWQGSVLVSGYILLPEATASIWWPLFYSSYSTPVMIAFYLHFRPRVKKTFKASIIAKFYSIALFLIGYFAFK